MYEDTCCPNISKLLYVSTCTVERKTPNIADTTGLKSDLNRGVLILFQRLLICTQKHTSADAGGKPHIYMYMCTCIQQLYCSEIVVYSNIGNQVLTLAACTLLYVTLTCFCLLLQLYMNIIHVRMYTRVNKLTPKQIFCL